MAGIYLHIPFCKKACHYCDFHFSVSNKLRSEMIDSMIKEIESRATFLNDEKIKTIYFGGGSPSILESSEIKRLLDKIHSDFQVESSAEITLEANPDDLDSLKLKELRQAGINRLSIGIQSFRDKDLIFMNRAHNSQMALDCIENSRKAGFKNLNVDLIYGIPGLTLNDWQKNLEHVFKANVEHLSSYNLTIEDKTAFGHWVKTGKLIPEKDENVIEQFKLLMSMAKLYGYEHYEISNFCKPAYESKHNSSYWKGEKYLGIGPSSHSFNGKLRSWNVKNNRLYINALNKNEVFSEEEILTDQDKFNEYILTNIRTNWGLDLWEIKTRFPSSFFNKIAEEIDIYLQSAHLIKIGNKIYLSEKGKFVADKVTSDLFIV